MKRTLKNNVITSITNNISIAWSQKSGSSTVIYMFFDYIKYNCKRDFIHRDRQDYYALSNRNSRLPDDLENHIIFQVVRNTYHRAVSSYLQYLLAVPTKSYDAIFVPANLNFIDFLLHIINEIKQNRKIDPHYDIQTQNITQYILQHNNIVYLESFAQDIEKINLKYDINLNSKTYYAPHAHTKIHNITKPYKEYYQDPLARKLVEEMYESDIENFKFLPIK